MPSQLVLVRHGETEWTITGQHTGRTDIPLTSNGREEARRVGSLLVGRTFAWVLSSPLTRALETCRLAGMGEAVETTGDLMEWDYGQYEGLTTAEIRKGNPRWSLWLDGAPGGETASDVAVRVDTVIKEAREQDGDVLVFAHGHVLRVLAARWLGLSPSEGRLFALHPAAVCTLGYERETAVLVHWNVSLRKAGS
ncbi:MAG: histidine phosphatase family protein [Actinomycetota bacterium]|nr:histidine phosphatase family protein [Actinomycetota bacterium]